MQDCHRHRAQTTSCLPGFLLRNEGPCPASAKLLMTSKSWKNVVRFHHWGSPFFLQVPAPSVGDDAFKVMALRAPSSNPGT